jgi:hypothetical protein
MTELPDLTPPWDRIPLVNSDTGLFPAETMTAIDERYQLPGRLSEEELNGTIADGVVAEAPPVAQAQSRRILGGRLYNGAKLSRFALARAREDVTPSVVTCLTHSIGWGIGSDDVNGGMVDPNGLYRENAWPVILRKLFALERGQAPAQNFLGLYPAYGVASLSSSPAPTFSTSLGPFDSYTSSGYAYGGYNLYTAGLASITIPSLKAGRFTAIDVLYWGSDSGVTNPVRPKVTIDGVVSDAGTTTVVGGNLNRLRITGLTDAAHEVILGHPGGSTNGCYVFGVVTHRGSGVIVNRIGAPGAKAYDVAGAAAGTGRSRNLDASVLAGYSNLVIIELDTNDVGAQTAISTWKTQMQEIITRAVNAGASVLLVASPPMNAGETMTIPESAYRTAMLELSDANAHTAYWDGSGVIGDRTQAVADGLYPPAAPTTVHFGTAGHRRYATAAHVALPLPAGDFRGYTPGFLDMFDRADSATTLGTTDDGKTWVPLNSSTWGITSNAAYCPTPGSNGFAVVETGAANGILTATMSVASDFAGLCFRVFDASNMLLVQRFGSEVRIRKLAGGVGSTIATTSGQSWANGDVLSVELNGSSVIVMKNGIVMLSQAITDFQSNTNHGLYSPVNTARYSQASFVAG